MRTKVGLQQWGGGSWRGSSAATGGLLVCFCFGGCDAVSSSWNQDVMQASVGWMDSLFVCLVGLSAGWD